jgi:hypothetical protein
MNKLFKRIATICHNLFVVLRDEDRKSVLRMCREFIRCSVACKCIAVHYFTSFLYRKDVVNVLDYLSHREGKTVQDLINHRSLWDIVSNKLTFCEHFDRGGFPVPRLLGYNLCTKAYLQTPAGVWESGDLHTPEILRQWLRRLMVEHGIACVFLKPIRGSQGGGAMRIMLGEIESRPEALLDRITCDAFVWQEVVRQHPVLAKLNPSALNSIRIDTFRGGAKEPRILSAFLRVGGPGNVVDNVAAGGVFIGIDLETGRLNGVARNYFHGSMACRTFKTSPATGIAFAGFQVPCFAEVRRLVLDAAAYLPPALVGWDVGISETGPVLIEANILYYAVTTSDIAYGGYRKHPVWREAVAYAKAAQR